MKGILTALQRNLKIIIRWDTLMKKWILLLCLFSFSLMAKPSERAGFQGEIALVAGIVSTNSNLSTAMPSIKSSPLNQKGTQEQSFILGPLANISFTYGQHLDKKWFVGTSQEDVAIGIVALEMGYQQTLPIGDVAISYLPTLVNDEVWRDPFAIDNKRLETQRKGQAYRLQLKKLAKLPISFDFAYAKSEIKDEQSGFQANISSSSRALLQRDDEAYYSKLTYRQFLGQKISLAPSYFYIKNKAAGDAMTFDANGLSLSFFYFSNNHNWVLTTRYLNQKYQAQHPLFLTIRQEKKYKIFMAYSYNHFLNIDSLSLISLASYNKIKANIDFYSADTLFTSFGIRYTF